MIPKKSDPPTVSDYRQISVLSAIPRIITKILASRLQPHLNDLIHTNQTAFIKGRQMMQTFLSARETLVHLSKKKSPQSLLKLTSKRHLTCYPGTTYSRCYALEDFPHSGWHGYAAFSFHLHLSSKLMV
jgi:Reverse transcriptase (RNA-dependent DNA polymerase)